MTREFSADTWRTATRTLPFTLQIPTLLLMLSGWLLGKWVFTGDGSEQGLVLTAVLVATAISAAIGATLIRSTSARRQGVGLSLAASSGMVRAVGAGIAAILR